MRPLTADEIREVQTRLKALGLDVGPIDGIPGPLTSAAIRRFEDARGIGQTGALDRPLFVRLQQDRGPALVFEPAVEVRVERPDRPVVYGVTNLPDGTELLVTIARTESRFMAQDKVVVRSGHLRSTQFSQRGADLNPGTYDLTITMSLAELQPKEVRDVVGAKGEKMIGRLVKTGKFGPTLEAVSRFSVGASADTRLDAKARAQAEQELRQWIVRSCNDSIELVNRMVRNGTVTGREVLGAERKKKVEQCIKEVGG